MFEIKSKETEGNKITYTLDHYIYAPRGIYDLFCSSDVVSIENENGEVLLTREDVSSIKFEYSQIIARVSDAKYESLVDGQCYFVLGKKKVHVNFIEDSDNKIVKSYPRELIKETIDENEAVYIKGALTLISEPPKGEVTATVIEEINGR